MTDENEKQHISQIADIIDTSGSFINNIKQPLFVLVLILLGIIVSVAYGAGVLGYKYLDTLNEQKKLAEKLVDLQSQNIELTKLVRKEVSKNNYLVQKGNDLVKDSLDK